MARQMEYTKLPTAFDCPSPDTCYCYGESMYHGDFYDSVSPSENIWKKFELLPTPPLSPQREDETEENSCFSSTQHKKSPEEYWLSTAICFDNKSAGLNSKLIQDCMWSGSDEKEHRSLRNRSVSLSELTMITTSASCVDPTSVLFPHRFNQEHSYSLTTPEPTKTPCTPFMTDSESEYVDVVNVESARRKIKKTRAIAPNVAIYSRIENHSGIKQNLSAVVAKLKKEPCKRPKCVDNFVLGVPSSKKRKYGSHVSIANTSDSDEFCGEGKRSQHNVLERKRRNDLKSSFLRLRDQLPNLHSQERAPKVTILNSATHFTQQLRTIDKNLVTELSKLRERNAALRQRLQLLQN